MCILLKKKKSQLLTTRNSLSNLFFFFSLNYFLACNLRPTQNQTKYCAKSLDNHMERITFSLVTLVKTYLIYYLFFFFSLPSLQSLPGCINNNISRNIYPAKANPAVLGSMTKTDISKGLGNFPSKIRQEDSTRFKPS